MKKFLGSITVLAGLFGAAFSAQAVPIKWTLTEVAFDGGGAASGSFVHDADLGTYSNISITTTPGTSGTPGSFSALCSDSNCAAIPTPSITFVNPVTSNDLTNVKLLYFVLTAPLPNAPGTADFSFGATGTCISSNCTGLPPDVQQVLSGSIVGTPYVAPAAVATPVPTLNLWGLMLLASLLGGLTFWRQRRQS